ncbi:hypothetical protein MHYP_G00110330 [Metynnis hypsauchen]
MAFDWLGWALRPPTVNPGEGAAEAPVAGQYCARSRDQSHLDPNGCYALRRIENLGIVLDPAPLQRELISRFPPVSGATRWIPRMQAANVSKQGFTGEVGVKTLLYPGLPLNGPPHSPHQRPSPTLSLFSPAELQCYGAIMIVGNCFAVIRSAQASHLDALVCRSSLSLMYLSIKQSMFTGACATAGIAMQNVINMYRGCMIRPSISSSLALITKPAPDWAVLSLKDVSPGEGNKCSSRKQIDIHFHKACCDSRPSAPKVTVSIEHGREKHICCSTTENAKESNKILQLHTNIVQPGDKALTVFAAYK